MAEPLNICVVDDDRDVAEGLAEILELAGHQVRTAFSGQDALLALEAADYDIAFINATLPDLNTLESFVAIRKVKPDLKAVMMTGYTVEQLLKQAVRDGPVSVLQKPVTMDEVVRALDGAKPKGIVLVAGDDPEIGAKISETLRLQDRRVGVARTVEDALDMVFAGDCDVLLLDLRLPVVRAMEVYLELAKQDRAVPTFVISKAPDKPGGRIDLLRDPTVTGVLVKPFDPALLLASLETVHKPASQRPPAERLVEKIAQPAANRGRILVIDDDRDLAEGLGDILRDLGHIVEIAFTGSEALEIARRFDAQIALVDIKLGRTSGLELIGSLKELRPGIVNVVITANAGKESVIAAMRSGAFDFLNKPMHPQDLFVIIDRCFEQIRAQEARTATSGRPAPDFVANVSHELRDPLNAVIGFSEILGGEMLGPLGSEQYVHYARGINEAGHHLTTVIDDLIDHNPPSAGRRGAEGPHGSGARGASGEDGSAEPCSAEPEPDEPQGQGTRPSGVGDATAAPDVPVSDQGEGLQQGPIALSSERPGTPQPEPKTPEPRAAEGGTLQSDRTGSDQPEAGPPAAEGAVARPDGAGEAHPGALRPQSWDAARDAPPRAPVDPSDAGPATPLLTGAVWESDQPIPPDPSLPQSGDADAPSQLAAEPWPTAAEPGMDPVSPAETAPPDTPWSESGQPDLPGTDPSENRSADSGPSPPAWSEPVWQPWPAADAPPIGHDMPGIDWDLPPCDDGTFDPPDAGAQPPGHSRAAEPDEEHDEQENEDEAPEGQETARRDQEPDGGEEKVVKLSPFRKVI